MLNINAASNSLAGKLTINGASRQGAESNTNTPLNTGLKIARQSVAPSAETSAKAVKKASEEEAKQKLIQNFEATLLSRLEKTENPNAQGKTPADTRAEEAKTLADSITATIEHVKKEFGKESANELMAKILTQTEDEVTADRIAGAITSVFTAFVNSAQETAASATASPDDLAKADETNKKLEKMLEFLNEGTAGDEGQGASLKDSLNTFFGLADFEENDQDRFNADFQWISRNEEIENEKAMGDQEKEFYLTIGELGQDNVDKLVNFLRNDLGDEAAAQYIETLGDGADIFEAVGELRNMFYEDSELVGYANSSTDFQLAHHEGPGMEKIAKLSRFLNENMLDEVNQIIRKDDGVRSRFLDMAAKKFDSADEIPATYGLSGWPGAGFGNDFGYSTGGTVFNGEHRWENN